jgi:hypothetical protein
VGLRLLERVERQPGFAELAKRRPEVAEGGPKRRA